MFSANTYPKNLRQHGWGWHRPAATAVRGFLNRERQGGNSGGGSIYPSLPKEDDTTWSSGNAKLYPYLPTVDEAKINAVVEEPCEAVNANLVKDVLSLTHLRLIRDVTY